MGRESRIERTGDVRDFANRALVEGDEVVLMHSSVPRFRVASIVPVVDPNAPPNIRRITLVSTVIFISALETPNGEFAIVRRNEEFAGPQQRTEEPPQ